MLEISLTVEDRAQISQGIQDVMQLFQEHCSHSPDWLSCKMLASGCPPPGLNLLYRDDTQRDQPLGLILGGRPDPSGRAAVRRPDTTYPPGQCFATRSSS